jgi:hypothetical protein
VEAITVLQETARLTLHQYLQRRHHGAVLETGPDEYAGPVPCLRIWLAGG